MSDADKIIRIQADRLAELLGLEKGTYIPAEDLKLISTTCPGMDIIIQQKPVTISTRAHVLAMLLLEKVNSR